MKKYFVALSLLVVAYQAHAQSQGSLDLFDQKSFSCVRKGPAIIDSVDLNYVSLKVVVNEKGSMLTIEGVPSLTNILVTQDDASFCELKDVNGKLFKTGRLVETLSFEMGQGKWFEISQLKETEDCDKGDLILGNQSETQIASLNLNYGGTRLSDFLCSAI